MKSSAKFLMVATAATFLGACAGSGFDKAVRSDVEARMSGAQPKLTACYVDALKRNRKAQGTVVVEFVAKANSGKFEDVRVVSSDLADPELDKCVAAEVASLVLEKPVKNQVAVHFPVVFSAKD